ncbi:hypothetical protein LEN26_010159 [Aphanomyces euteiches]|nr:hypothetical protein AeMF1_008259 [Aphanomyces euteiches]KAH9122680.1 hypothetical protein LEN26_010159 [Aphanomyces euteiches]
MENSYDLSDVSDYTFKAVMAATRSEHAAITWCLKVGLFRNKMFCSSCFGDMKLTKDLQRWRCCRRERELDTTVRKNSPFCGSGLPTSTLILVLYYWATRKTSSQQVVQVHREICSKEMRSCTIKIGGVRLVVEIDETSLKKKSKYGRGTQHEDCWLFGGVDRATKKWFGVLTYNDRTKAKLMPIIANHIAEGTLIVSDKFSSYVSANERHTLANSPAHMWVNHSTNFVNPVNGAHTQSIEGVWEVRIKHYLKAMRGVRRDLLQGYIDELVWRSWFFLPKATCSISNSLQKEHYQLLFGKRKSQDVTVAGQGLRRSSRLNVPAKYYDANDGVASMIVEYRICLRGHANTKRSTPDASLSYGFSRLAIGTFEPVDPVPVPGRSAIKCRFVYAKKTDSHGNLVRCKARLVAQGFRQVEGVDYEET